MPMNPHTDRIVRALRNARRLPRRGLSTGLAVGVEANRIRTERAWGAEIDAAGRGDERVVVGPWISEVGFEVLYWIPMLNRIAQRHGVASDQITTFTRGGAHCWYRDIADRGVEIFDLIEPEELREFNERRVEETGGQKHMAATALDTELVLRAGDRLPADAQLIHPSLMYNAFRYLWAWRTPPKAVLRKLEFRRLPDPGRADIAARLPDEYVAVKAYHSSCFPPTPENQAFVAALVRRLAERTPVVLLSTGLHVDDHLEVTVASDGELIDAQPWMTPRDNLEVQTQIIQGAQCLFSSYGGFSYLGPFLGVPSVCFWSQQNFNATHLEVMRGAVKALKGPRFIALDTADFGLLDRVLSTADAEVAL
jgi:hypothetical protein